jgi:uncharacterized protein YecE (DUF72 family)
MLPFFEPELAPQAARLATKLRSLADEGVYFGTSSWKYDGWLGSIYTRENYVTRGKFSQAKFEAECLREYAAAFPIVCGDFSFYQFPTAIYWQRLFNSAPRSLQFGFKVPEEITVPVWPRHARYGARAGNANPGFLDPVMFDAGFTTALEPYRAQVAVLIFEFGTFAKSIFRTVSDFCTRLEAFLRTLPPGFRYAVEIRNPEYLKPEYFATLAEQNVAHAFNAWTRMPEVRDQIEIADAYTADFSVVRALLRKDRTYEQAVATFQPYRELQDPNPELREALRRIVNRARRERQPTFQFINNRLEGNAPTTIEAVISELDVAVSPSHAGP